MIAQQQAIELFERDDLIGLGMAADGVRKQMHPEGMVSYCMQTADEITATLTFKAEAPLDFIVSRLEEMRTNRRLLAVMPRCEGTGVEYLKVLALTRIYLDNVPHIQASWQASLKMGQVALGFGANDIDGAEAGDLRASEEDIRRVIRDAGFVPKQRDALFQAYYLD